ALQAQDYAQAVWAIGVRTESATLADVERAIEDARILRTWPMRGTIHFVPAHDASWMLALSGPRAIAKLAGRHRQLGLDETVLDRARAVFETALANGPRTRSELMAELEHAG